MFFEVSQYQALSIITCCLYYRLQASKTVQSIHTEMTLLLLFLPFVLLDVRIGHNLPQN